MKKPLDLNVPKDAKDFLLRVLPQALPTEGGEQIVIHHVILADGSRLKIDDMNDSELVQYAWELLPMFKAKFPDNVNVEYEQ